MTDETRRPIVLNVDDYEASRYLRTQALTRAGFVVREAGTGREALSIAATSPPSVVLLDVNLPDMSGFEVCRRLKRQAATADVPVLHLSATFTKDSYKVQGLEGGADGYLTEPVDPPVLVATINAVLRARRAEAERDLLLARERAARAEAEAANRAKDDFLAMVSHELRTPLNAVLGWTRVLRSSTLSPDAVARALETIERSVRHQAEIVNDLLDVSRIISGTLALNFQSVDVAGVVRGAVEAIGPVAADKEIAVELTIDDGAALVIGDPSRLQQVVGNLLSNAVKFTPEKGRVHVRLTTVDGLVRIVVADTGAGIAPAFLPHVFDRFRQADSHASRAQGGLGLGLAIVRHLVDLHGGTVVAESAGEGQGATFTVTLPIHTAARPALAEPDTAPRTWSTLLHGLRILLVEDEVDSREALAVAFASFGASVRAAGTVAEALEALETDEAPDALVSDIGMPGEDGYALIRRFHALMRARGLKVPTIALTAYARRPDVEAVLNAGYDVHIPKPADIEDLARAVAMLVRRDRGQRPA
jgi:signal transduction histidine kinase